jgi:hypothetical protein
VVRPTDAQRAGDRGLGLAGGDHRARLAQLRVERPAAWASRITRSPLAIQRVLG